MARTSSSSWAQASGTAVTSTRCDAGMSECGIQIARMPTCCGPCTSSNAVADVDRAARVDVERAADRGTPRGAASRGRSRWSTGRRRAGRARRRARRSRGGSRASRWCWTAPRSDAARAQPSTAAAPAGRCRCAAPRTRGRPRARGGAGRARRRPPSRMSASAAEVLLALPRRRLRLEDAVGEPVRLLQVGLGHVGRVDGDAVHLAGEDAPLLGHVDLVPGRQRAAPVEDDRLDRLVTRGRSR